MTHVHFTISLTRKKTRVLNVNMFMLNVTFAVFKDKNWTTPETKVWWSTQLRKKCKHPHFYWLQLRSNDDGKWQPVKISQGKWDQLGPHGPLQTHFTLTEFWRPLKTLGILWAASLKIIDNLISYYFMTGDGIFCVFAMWD